MRQRKILRFTSVTIWKDLANQSSFFFYPTTQISSSFTSSSPQAFNPPPLYCYSCYHQFIREESTLISSQNRMVNTSFSFYISLGTFLLMKVQRKAIRWSAACTFLLNLIQANSAQINDIFCSSSPVVCSCLQVATPSLTAVMIAFKADGSFCLILTPHFWTTMQSNQIVFASSRLTSHPTRDSKNYPVILPQLQSRLMIVVQFFMRQKRLLYPNQSTSASSYPSVQSERNLTVNPCNNGAINLFPNALCSPAARATLVASRWNSGFSTIRLNLVKSSEKRGIASDRGCPYIVETNQRKVSRMLPSESLLKKPVIERRTQRCSADWGYYPFRRKGLRYVEACCLLGGCYWIGCYQSYCCDGYYCSWAYYSHSSSPSYSAYYPYSYCSSSSMSGIDSAISSRLSNILSYSSSN